MFDIGCISFSLNNSLTASSARRATLIIAIGNGVICIDFRSCLYVIRGCTPELLSLPKLLIGYFWESVSVKNDFDMKFKRFFLVLTDFSTLRLVGFIFTNVVYTTDRTAYNR
jgi:hypothetical protein